VLSADNGHPVEGREHLERALAIWEASLGPDHPKIGDCRAALARLQPPGPASPP
jgi:hypothetical protein